MALLLYGHAGRNRTARGGGTADRAGEWVCALDGRCPDPFGMGAAYAWESCAGFGTLRTGAGHLSHGRPRCGPAQNFGPESADSPAARKIFRGPGHAR